MRRFPPVEDIPGIEKKAVDINKTDRQMRELIRDVQFAVKQDRKSNSFKEFNSMLDDLLRQFLYTHQSIRLLLKHAYKNDDYPTASDAASLVREQIEKIYIIVTITQDPEKWIKQFLRNAWLKSYEQYLLEKDERGKIQRFDEYLKEYYPTFLENMRQRPARRGKKEKRPILLTRFAIRCARYNWYYPGGPKPKWFNLPKLSVYRFVQNYFHFPSPWQSVELVRGDADYFKFLDRWYREYKYYSSFSHVLLDKMLLQHFSQYKSVAAAEQLKRRGQTMSEQFVTMSNTAAATICTLILTKLSNDYGTKRQTKEFWELIDGYSLSARALWKLCPKTFLN